MPRVAVNLDNISDGFKLIEPGDWLSELIECDEETSSTGNPMLVWTWQITEGSSKGDFIKSFTSLQDHALMGLKEHMIAFGSKGGEIDINTDRLIGRKARLRIRTVPIKHRETGEDMNVSRVDSVKPPTAGRASGSTRTVNSNDGRSAGRSSPARKPEPKDDDLPF